MPRTVTYTKRMHSAVVISPVPVAPAVFHVRRAHAVRRQCHIAATTKEPVTEIYEGLIAGHAKVKNSHAERVAEHHIGNGTGSALRSRQASSTEEDSEFEWDSQWYPVSVAADLDPGRPHALSLLGRRLVLWHDGGGKAGCASDAPFWRCFPDRCPHRAAPLSEGRVEGGQLHCSLHGFSFGGDGGCACVPQLGGPPHGAAAASLQINGFPVQVTSDGILWVFGSPDAAAAEAAAPPPPGPASCIPGAVQMGGAYARDLPYGYTSLLDNLLDVTHVAHAHHGVMGNRDKDSTWTGTVHEVPGGQLTGRQGFAFQWLRSKPGASKPALERIQTLQAPAAVTYILPIGGPTLITQLLCTPLAANRSRVIISSFMVGAPPLMQFLARLSPTWLLHISMQHAVFDGDAALLAGQEATLAAEAAGAEGAPGSNGNWPLSSFHMPSPADKPVRKWYAWIKEAGRPPCDEPAARGASSVAASSVPRPKAALLDRLGQHTAHCPSCSKAMRRFESLAAAASKAAAIAASAAVAAAAVANGGIWPGPTILAGVAAVAFVLHSWAAGMAQRFKYEDYVHQDH